MISKRVECDAANDNYGRLARYISAGHDRQDTEGQTLEEKCLMHWCAGCNAGDDYDLAIKEVAATQALNTRTKKEKTYHLIVSFRPEDADKLTPDTLKAIEQRFADCLGLADHQRHCGVHVNTENTHLHVAYNLIHPDRYTRHEPYLDFKKRDALCRQLEQEFGLMVDNGRDKTKGQQPDRKAASMEAHSGMVSFERFAQEQATPILGKATAARTWEDLHRIFARHGLALAPRGNGLIVKEISGKHTAKASTMHRDFSLKKLESRFGKFAPAKGQMPEPEIRYHAKPLQKMPDKTELWTAYQKSLADKKTALETSRRKWETYRTQIRQQPMGRRARAAVLKKSRTNERQERKIIFQKYPASWMDFLRQQATLGNGQALDILRSRKEPYQPDALELAQRQQMETMRPQVGNKSVSQVLMESIVPEVKTQISRHGVIIFSLPDGGKICDSGRKITFSENAKEKATEYMAAKWMVKKQEWGINRGSLLLPDGQYLEDTGKNMFVRPVIQGREKQRGLER